MEKKKMAGHASLFAANLIFGINNPLSRSLMPEVIDPYTLTFFRFGGGMVLFWLVSLFTPNEKVDKKDFLLLFLASLFALVLNQLLFFIGLASTSSIDASIVVTLLPIVTMLLAAVFIREPITLLKVVGVLVGASGALIIVFNRTSGGSGQGNFFGNMIVFSAVIAFSLYLTLFKKLISKYSGVTLMKWMFLFATVVAFPFYIHPLMETRFETFSSNVILRIIYVVVFATFIGYLLIPIGQKTLRPTTLSMYNYVQPVVSSALAILLGSEHFSLGQALAGALVFAGVYIVTQSKTKTQLEAEKAGLIPKRTPPTGE